MDESKSETKDPVCGMTVDKETTLLAQRDGKNVLLLQRPLSANGLHPKTLACMKICDVPGIQRYGSEG